MTPVPAVCAIVVNWNRCSETLACLASLARATYPSLAVLVVDNMTTDDTDVTASEAFRRDF